MSASLETASPSLSPLQLLQQRKGRVAAMRTRVREMFVAGVPGIQIATAHCDAMQAFVLELLESALGGLSRPEHRKHVAANAALVAIGGTGRGELCPYSDVDLLLLDGDNASQAFRQITSTFLQSGWDAGLQLGHSVRTLRECIALARQDAEVATSLVEARLLWGSEELFAKLERQFRRQVVDGRKSGFVQHCLEARLDAGPQRQELEPDVKNSIGGLRDLHLLRWLGFALCGARDIDSLKLHGLIDKDEARTLKSGWEFLTRIRIDLHLQAGREQDRLTRDEQLRIAESRGIEATQEQRPVERLMQELFQHTTGIAEITRRFAERHRPRSLTRRTRDLILGHRAEGVLRVSAREIDARPRDIARLCKSLDSILKVVKAAALYNVGLSPRILDAIKSAAPQLSPEVTPYAAKSFLEILRCTAPLPRILRQLAETRILDVLIPDYTRIRCLMQFNQYHHFTVDEHTLRTLEEVTRFEQADTPIGAAYRALKNKELLHLALILHDIGKGFVEDHCVVGEEVASRIGPRLGLTQQQTETIAFLVRWHLEMADVAFRRDITDERTLVMFSHLCSSPERLRMLFVLTAADVSGVGPGVWTDWKSDLLAELYDRCLLILSGKHYTFHEQERMQQIKQRVATVMNVDPAETERRLEWVDHQLTGFSAYYLTCTAPDTIAADLRVIEGLSPDDVHVTGVPDPSTGTVEYRVITRNSVAVRGCFHRICGVLSAKRCSILSADINTAHDGVIVDTFRVIDTDFSGPIPVDRIEEVSRLIGRVLRREETIDDLFRRNRRFGSDEFDGPVSDLPPRVAVDTDSSDTRTIVDVFAHDRPGLLYRVARVLHELNVSVDLAKISTNFDQVVDVFYLTEQDGRKIVDQQRITEIHDRLMQTLTPTPATNS
ncbi:MAG: [protein-PII] uridylyltransferase [Planctomycetaceae bacterium]|nr:[protein-PII] uridylyltransferase [Planctomycetaceae bacterium]